METNATFPDLPELTNAEALAELVSRLHRKLPAGLADEIAHDYARALFAAAASGYQVSAHDYPVVTAEL